MLTTKSSRGQPLLASFHFGALPVAKYTTQFMDSYASFVNHIPLELQGKQDSPNASSTADTNA